MNVIGSSVLGRATSIGLTGIVAFTFSACSNKAIEVMDSGVNYPYGNNPENTYYKNNYSSQKVKMKCSDLPEIYGDPRMGVRKCKWHENNIVAQSVSQLAEGVSDIVSGTASSIAKPFTPPGGYYEPRIRREELSREMRAKYDEIRRKRYETPKEIKREPDETSNYFWGLYTDETYKNCNGGIMCDEEVNRKILGIPLPF